MGDEKKTVIEEGAKITDSMLKSLEGAESADELITHLAIQTKGNQERKLGSGSSNRIIVFIRNQLEDRFGMSEDEIEKKLREFK